MKEVELLVKRLLILWHMSFIELMLIWWTAGRWTAGRWTAGKVSMPKQLAMHTHTTTVYTGNTQPYHASRVACVHVGVASLTGACKCIDSESESVECVDHTHCSTPHVAALALPALTAPVTHSLALFPSPNHLFVVCRVWSCDVKMSSAHCLAKAFQ